MSQSIFKSIRCVVTGTHAAGKTCMLTSYFEHTTLNIEYIPTDEPKRYRMKLGDRQVVLDVWDTPGSEDCDHERLPAYAGVDVVIICFSIANPDSLTQVTSKWQPEAQKYAPGVPLLLVGSRIDLRDEEWAQQVLRDVNMVPVPYEDGMHMAKTMSAPYVECSAKSRENLADVFDEAVKLVK